MIDQIIKWQEDRNLDKMPYNHANETLNNLEEICEAWGLNRDFALLLLSLIQAESDEPICEHAIIDSCFDDCVYNIGKILKLGYDPKKVFEEGLKEINERTGAYDLVVGKWVKQPKKPNAYKADYSKAKL